MKYEEKISIIKKTYEKVRKKYNLPLLKDLEIEFLFYVEDLSGEEEMILASLRSSILNFISSVRRDIETLLSGAESYCCYFERRAFNKNEKMKLFEIYKTIQEIFWEGKIVALRSEKEKANWIKRTYQFWKKELKKDVEWYNDKMQKSWVDLKASDSELKYVG